LHPLVNKKRKRKKSFRRNVSKDICTERSSGGTNK
jgi:hypothetical protein